MSIPNTPPRVALMLSGQPRAVAETFPYIKKHILACNQNVDVFIHCWYDPNEVGNPFTGSSTHLVKVQPNLLAEDAPALLTELYQPVAILTEPQIDFTPQTQMLPEIPRGLVNPFAIFSAWKSRQRCNALLTAHEKALGFTYDYVVSTRTDCLLLRDIPIVSFLAQGVFHIHGHDVRNTFGISDTIYIASSNQMRSIVGIADKIETYVHSTRMWNAEAQLLCHLALEGVPVHPHYWYPILVRGDAVYASIFRGIWSYMYAAVKDTIREIPVLRTIFLILHRKYRGDYVAHIDWIRNRETGLLKQK